MCVCIYININNSLKLTEIDMLCQVFAFNAKEHGPLLVNVV